jgi:SagB-type dehydrogenase family enzyme
MYWAEYHEATKHSHASLQSNVHFLDWANMPDPFRHYEGAPLLDFAGDPAMPGIPALDVLFGNRGTAESEEFLSRLLFYSASISAAKQAPSGDRYALRVNPSSGNLHPTEFHFACPDGVYHYRPSSHACDRRGAGDYGPLRFVLTTIAWREAWKYQSRAYRYCLHDAGHAAESLALAARAIGCRVRTEAAFSDDDVARQFDLATDEWPMLLVHVEDGPLIPPAAGRQWFGGVPNRLSRDVIQYPRIEAMHAASKQAAVAELPPDERAPRIMGGPSFGEVVRRRRSALDFTGGDRAIEHEQLAVLLQAALGPPAARFDFGRFVELYVYVHRVRDVEPGVYRVSNAGEIAQLWSGDQRAIAAELSLDQALAGNACVVFSMIGDLEAATRRHGDRGYRYVHFEAGAIGQRLYIAAEALGFQSTGMGAFYDDLVNRYLKLAPEAGQVVYHFACGYAVDDNRLLQVD